jgi:hypothetical protein
MKVTAQKIEIALSRKFDYRQNLIVPNVSWGLWLHECDLLIMSKSGYLTEIEIKVSTSDLKKDAQKRHGHHNEKIKKLYFAIPEKLLKHESFIPERAGIIIYNSERDWCRFHRNAKTNNTAKPLSVEDQYQLARLGALRIWGLKSKIENLKHRCEVSL